MIREFPKRQQAKEPPVSARKLDLVAGFLRYWKFGILAGLVVLAVGLPYAWFKGKAVYRAEGVIYISPQFQRNLDTDPEHQLQSNSQYREFVQQQVRTINRFDIVQHAMEGSSAVARYWGRPGESPRRSTDRLRSSLQITPVTDTYQVTVALEREDPRGLSEIINDVMKAYVDTMHSELMFDSEARLSRLDAEKSDLNGQIQALMDQRTGIAKELGTTVFSESLVNSYDKMLGASSEALMEARRQRFVAEAGATGSSTEQGVQAEALEKALNDAGVASLKSSLNSRRAELLARISGLSPQHAGRVAAEKELREIDAELESLTDRMRSRLADALRAVRSSKLYQTESVEQRLQLETKTLREQAESYSRAYQHSLDIGQEIDRLRKRESAVEDRMDYLRLETQAPGWVRIFSPALTPDLPLQGGRRKLGLLVLLAALAMALAVPAGLDYVDPRIRAAQELEIQSGVPVTAWLPHSEHPMKMDGAAILRAAISIRRHLPELARRALVISAVNHGGGSTTFTLALAETLNRLGVRTLVIEANPLTRDARYESPLSRPGLIQIMAGESNLSESTLAAEPGLPERVATGAGIIEDLLPAERLLQVLEQAAPVYDLVLIDAAPVQRSLATEELVRVADSVVIVADAQTDRKADVNACMERLEHIRPAAFGSVLNKVPNRPTFPLRRNKSNDPAAVFAA